ncbi:MAG: hypothetical protein BWY68_00494 [bacterium ADurb.Bin400]|nr:MAG: hypothetical protein BWY68_00494 [bacterium ADurb.Bin400]
MFASFIAGSIVGVVLIALKIKSRKDALPFAPFLIGGALFGLLYGQRVVDWYLSSFII